MSDNKKPENALSGKKDLKQEEKGKKNDKKDDMGLKEEELVTKNILSYFSEC